MHTSDFDPKVSLVNPETGEKVPSDALEGAGTMFDPYSQHLDLSKEEKRRTTALMLAIQGYKELIIKDADYLREMHNKDREGQSRGEPPLIKPATVDAMVVAACKFDAFIAGEIRAANQPALGGAMTEEKDEPETGAEPQAL